jgi:RNA polymerase sigma-70 factor (ECF subfamily)
MAGSRDEQFEELYKYMPAVRGYLKRFGFSPDELDDIAHDVFVRVYQHMDDYRGESRLAYLQEVTRNVALNKIRDRHAGKREGILVPEEKLAGYIDESVPSPEATAAKRFDSLRLREAVERLDDNQRVCVMLYLADFSYLEIGEILGISQPALKSRLNVAREKLKEWMGQGPEGWGGRDD